MRRLAALLGALALVAVTAHGYAKVEPSGGATGAGVAVEAPGAARGAGPGGEFAGTPIRHRSAASKEAGKPAGQGDAKDASQAPTPAKPSATGEATRIGAALAAVLGLIFFLRWGARRLFAMPTAARSTDAVRVLSRTVLSPKQQLVLLQVGRRVLAVAAGGTQMNALCQITDPDEVASLVGQLRAEKESGPAKAFGSLFGRVRGKFQAEAEAAEVAGAGRAGVGAAHAHIDITDTDAGPDRETASDKRHGRGSAAERARRGAGGAEEPNVEAVADTREELKGLLEKVRLVSNQFGRV